MLFTIAIPTYNNASTVLEAVKSALNQDYNDEYEILIVNNASTDDTAKVLGSLCDSRIRIVTNQVTVDLFQNHNVCFQEAKGDYVLFCHSDDILLPNALRILAEKIIQRGYPSRYILWGRSMFRDYYQVIKSAGYGLNQIICGEKALECFVRIYGLTPSGTCYSRKSILEIGAFPTMKTKTTPLDWYIMVWAIFNFFEMEMIDRIIFIRKFASTAKNVPKSRISSDSKDVFDILWNCLDNQQRGQFIQIMYQNLVWQFYPVLKKYINRRKQVKYLMKILLHTPWSFLRLLKAEIFHR